MYSTCMFCNRPLGTNEVVEHFPVGRRLAFDAARGRLWVVCRKCERWNLSPLAERWEAVELCESIFRDTRLAYPPKTSGSPDIRRAWNSFGSVPRCGRSSRHGGTVISLVAVAYATESLVPAVLPSSWEATS